MATSLQTGYPWALLLSRALCASPVTDNMSSFGDARMQEKEYAKRIWIKKAPYKSGWR
jgi:hypothetical protein